MLDTIQKKYSSLILKPYLQWYLKKERSTTVQGFKLTIKPSVFHPKYFFSSLYLFKFITTLNLNNKSFLEIGCGSGFISLLAYQKKAIVTCCDINPNAIECTNTNFKKNFNTENNNFTVINSDLFDKIPKTSFDYIVINPPYFFEEIKNQNQLAWNCGKNGEYFNKLFFQLNKYIHNSSKIIMILAENCEIDRIKKIAEDHGFKFELLQQQKIKWELNYIFEIIDNKVS